MRHQKNINFDNKKYKFSDGLGKLMTYCKSNLPAIILALMLAIGGTIFTIISPDKLSELTVTITSGIMTGVDLKLVGSIGLTLIIYFSSSAVLSYLQNFIMASVTQKVTKKLRNDISKKINKLPLKYFDSNSTGDILSRVTNDVDTIGQTLNQTIGSLVSAVVLLLGSVIMMFVTNWILALVAISASIIGFVFMGIIGSKSQKYYIKQQQLLGKINGHIEEVYTGHNVVKAYNAEKRLGKQFAQINKELHSCNWKSQFMSGLMMPIMSFIGIFAYLAVCVAGALLSKNNTADFIGVIVAFMAYVKFFTQPLSTIAQSMSSIQSASAASFRVFEFLEEKELQPENSDLKVLNDVKGDLEFKNVKFGYDEKKIIINDFSAKVKAGQKIAIVGPTGAGKTTMVNLLMRFYELNSGDITVDGVSIKNISRENVHDLFCMVLQDTWLFEGTIKENIIYSSKNITDEDVISACETVGIDHFIRTLPEGYNTILNEEATLSAGQKQLITIARAMIENSPMLILDEATSSVDTRTEVLIQNAMDKLMKGRTSIIIAHRLSTIKNADLILVMKDGDIIEKGSHKELIKLNGFYADLYNSQFDNKGDIITE